MGERGYRLGGRSRPRDIIDGKEGSNIIIKGVYIILKAPYQNYNEMTKNNY